MTTRAKKVTALKFWVRIIVENDEPGFHAYAPSLKGLHMGGDTPEAALNNAKEAAELYLKSLLKHGDPIPIDVMERATEGEVAGSKNVISSQVEEIRVSI